MKNPMNKKGFTLIELLIVISIIGILAVAFLPSMLNAPAKARDTERIAHLTKIANFLTLENTNGTLPKVVNFNANGDNCISKDLNNPVSNLIKSKLADFSGEFPQEPVEDYSFKIEAFECTGAYFYTIDAPFFVAAQMEVEENGNYEEAGVTYYVIRGQ